jgi:adenosylcobinamide-GDP ribazoletransferase
MKSFLLALRFLTIIPLGQGKDITSEAVAAAGKYYPLVGLIIGGLLWGFYQGVGFLFPDSVAVGLVLVFWVLLIGALHLDGLADCLDGLYGGNSPEERLRIMKDIHLGTMGTVGLILVLGMKYLLLREMLSFPAFGVWLFFIPAVSRWTPIFLGILFSYARPDGGLGPGIGNREKGTVLGHPSGLGAGGGDNRIYGSWVDRGHSFLELVVRLVLSKETGRSHRGCPGGRHRNQRGVGPVLYSYDNES